MYLFFIRTDTVPLLSGRTLHLFFIRMDTVPLLAEDGSCTFFYQDGHCTSFLSGRIRYLFWQRTDNVPLLSGRTMYLFYQDGHCTSFSRTDISYLFKQDGYCPVLCVDDDRVVISQERDGAALLRLWGDVSNDKPVTIIYLAYSIHHSGYSQHKVLSHTHY